MSEISFTGRKLKIGEFTITFDYPVQEVLEKDDKILVLLEGMNSETVNSNGVFTFGPVRPDNVIALDKEGNQLWTIEVPESSSNGYIWLEEDDEGRVVAEYYDSWVYEVDLETGNIEALYWRK